LVFFIRELNKSGGTVRAHVQEVEVA
jgi:hypothetical protein